MSVGGAGWGGVGSGDPAVLSSVSHMAQISLPTHTPALPPYTLRSKKYSEMCMHVCQLHRDHVGGDVLMHVTHNIILPRATYCHLKSVW